MKPTICHIIPYYLITTTNWIYSQIKYAVNYNHYVLTEKIIDSEKYPIEHIFVKKEQSRALALAARVSRKLFDWPQPDYTCCRSILRENPAVLIHAHFGPTGFYSVNLKKMLNLPLVTRFYGYDVGRLPRHPRWRKRYRRLFREGDVFITEGANMKHLLEAIGCPSEKIVVHHLGVEVDYIKYAEHKPKPKSFRILIAAAFKEKKGLEYALMAIAKARDALVGTKLNVVLIGDGPLKENLSGLAEQLGINPLIEWLGYQSHEEFVRHLYQADAFLSPSVTAANGDTEGGAPIAIIEAAASGLPVISTIHADIPDVILHGKTGILAPEHDVSALADAICVLANNPDMRYRYSRYSRQHIENNYDARKQGLALEEIYKNIVL